MSAWWAAPNAKRTLSGNFQSGPLQGWLVARFHRSHLVPTPGPPLAGSENASLHLLLKLVCPATKGRQRHGAEGWRRGSHHHLAPVRRRSPALRCLALLCRDLTLPDAAERGRWKGGHKGQRRAAGESGETRELWLRAACPPAATRAISRDRRSQDRDPCGRMGRIAHSNNQEFSSEAPLFLR